MMNIAQAIKNEVEIFPAGQIFGYQALPIYTKSPVAVIKAISRMVADQKLERFSKGRFYVPKKGVLGSIKPTDAELIRSELYKDGQLRGYVTGQSLYNLLGLTTQIPSTITIAFNGGRQLKDYGTIRIRKIVTRIPIKEQDVKLLQYLDALKDIKKISDSNINQSLSIMSRYVSELSASKQAHLLQLVMKYYTPQVRALVGLLFTNLGVAVPKSLASSLNPITVYKLKLDQSIWPLAKDWNIQ